MKFSWWEKSRPLPPEHQPEPPRHLKDGVKAIIACVGTPDQFRENSGIETELKGVFRIVPKKSGASNIDYYGDPTKLTEQNFKNAGRYSYVISPADGFDKFSGEFANCTGLVVTGQDKSTGENISFLSHQDPGYFLAEKTNSNQFVEDLRQRLKELKERSVEGTIDAVIVGGNYFTESEGFLKNYLESIKLLSEEISKILGFQPIVMTGPKTTSGRDHVFYDNKNRRLYIMRPNVGDDTTKSFSPSEIKDQEKKWR